MKNFLLRMTKKLAAQTALAFVVVSQTLAAHSVRVDKVPRLLQALNETITGCVLSEER